MVLPGTTPRVGTGSGHHAAWLMLGRLSLPWCGLPLAPGGLALREALPLQSSGWGGEGKGPR